MKTYFKIVFVAVTVVLLGVMGTASADVYPGTVSLTIANTGGFPGPYATVTETAISGGVHFEVDAIGAYLMRNFYFNTSLTDLSGVSITNIVSNGSPASVGQVPFDNNVSAFGIFDLALTKTGQHNISSLSFDILGGGLDTFFDANGKGHHYAASILGPNANGRTFFATDGPTSVPEPGMLILFGSGLLGLGLLGRKKFGK